MQIGVPFVRGSGSFMFTIPLYNSSTGDLLTGLSSSSTNLTIEMRRAFSATKTSYTGAAIQTITTLGTYAAPTANTQIRFKETDVLGLYEFQVHDTATNGGGSGDSSPYVDVKVYEATTTALNLRKEEVTIPLTSFATVADIWANATRTLTAPTNLFTSANALAVDASGRVILQPSGLDAVLVESGITPGAGLTNDATTQLSSINARQALALVLASASMGVLSGALTTTITVKQAGIPTGVSRIVATVDTAGNRSAFTVIVPT